MRITVPTFKQYRKAIDYSTKYVPMHKTFLNMDDYVFTPPAPVAVRDKISNRKDRSKSGLCLQEMALMLSCWNENDYSESICSKEIQSFEKCWTVAAKQAKLMKEQEITGITSNSGRASSAQVNKLLKRYPSPSKT